MNAEQRVAVYINEPWYLGVLESLFAAVCATRAAIDKAEEAHKCAKEAVFNLTGTTDLHSAIAVREKAEDIQRRRVRCFLGQGGQA